MLPVHVAQSSSHGKAITYVVPFFDGVVFSCNAGNRIELNTTHVLSSLPGSGTGAKCTVSVYILLVMPQILTNGEEIETERSSL